MFTMPVKAEVAITEHSTHSITPINDWSALKHILEKVHPDGLVVFDVDWTLIIPKDKVLRPGAQSVWGHVVGVAEQQSNIKITDKHISKLLKEREIELVSPDIPKILQDITAHGAKILALTALKTGSLGDISNMEDWRIEELKMLGLDFSKSFPNVGEIVFPSRGQNGGKAVYKDGILFTDRLSKGIVLGAFLDRLHWEPSEVIFIDDRMDYLKSVEDWMALKDIPYRGFHINLREPPLSKKEQKLGIWQLTHLLKHGRWHNDEFAKAYMLTLQKKHTSSL